MRSFALVVALGLAAAIAACTGDSPKSDGGQKCIGMLYDPCNTEHDCNNGNCVPFADKGIMVCSQSCVPANNGSDCPPQYMDPAKPATCTANGACEPPAANSCKIQ